MNERFADKDFVIRGVFCISAFFSMGGLAVDGLEGKGLAAVAERLFLEDCMRVITLGVPRLCLQKLLG